MTNKMISNIIENYDIDASRPPVLLQEGVDNSLYIFRLKNNRKAVIRIGKRDTINDEVFEIKLLSFLRNKQLAVPHIIPTKNQKLSVLIKNKAIVAFEFIDGTTLSVESNKKPPAHNATIAGRSLGMLHAIGDSFQYKDPNRRTIFTEFDRALAKSDTIAKLISGREFLQTIENYYDWAKKYEGTIGVIHNDYIPSNILYQSNSAVILDFDWSCYGPLIKDLGIALATWSRPDGLEKHWKDIFISFVEGYSSSAQQKIEINSALYKWICFSCLSDACTFFADLSNDNTHITNVHQCRRYQTFLYFSSFITD